MENVLAAVCAARLAGVSAETIRASVAAFKAVEHRLELVRSVNGVEFYNDSKATNVDAAMKAVASFAGGIHLILGGKDKDSDYSADGGLLRERVKVVYTIGSAAEKIERQLQGVVKMVSAGTMQVAVAEAAKAAVAGDVVLLSPACSSFDQFENYEHRGRVFRQLVNELRVSSSSEAGSDGMAKRVGVDKWLFGMVLLLVLFGLVTVFSASAVMAQASLGSPYSYVVKQAIWARAGDDCAGRC